MTQIQVSSLPRRISVRVGLYPEDRIEINPAVLGILYPTGAVYPPDPGGNHIPLLPTHQIHLVQHDDVSKRYLPLTLGYLPRCLREGLAEVVRVTEGHYTVQVEPGESLVYPEGLSDIAWVG